VINNIKTGYKPDRIEQKFFFIMEWTIRSVLAYKRHWTGTMAT